MARELWVLGADDPEMTLIERQLRSRGRTVAYAVDGKSDRVHGGNAYRAAWHSGGSDDFTSLCLVECSPGPLLDFAQDHDIPVRVFDHHRPGDPGHGKPPEDFLVASSLGQVLLALDGGFDGRFDFLGGWNLRSMSDPPEDGGTGDWYAWPIDHDIILTAAADHCLEAAYRNRCARVDPGSLLVFRIRQKAAQQKRPVEAVSADIENARELLRAEHAKWLQESEEQYAHESVGRPFVADLRNRPPIPELPEAACYEGLAYLVTVTEPGGRTKVVLGAARPDTVDSFLRGDLDPRLTDYYGDRERGYAGGYLSD